MIFLHSSLVWTLFTLSFVKMAWPSTLLNQLSFCLLPALEIVLSYYLSSFFSSPNLSGRRLDIYHTSTYDVALLRI